MKKISVLTPFKNEEQNIEFYFDQILSVVNLEKNYKFELICVDDGSSDATLSLLLNFAKLDTRVTVIQLSRCFGKEAAVTAGLDYADSDAVVIIDADGQDPFGLIPDLIRGWEAGADVVLAKRESRKSDHFLKRASSFLYYKLHNLASDVPIPENVGDFRLMDSAVVRAIKAFPEKERFMKGIFAWAGFKSVTIGYIRQPRFKGGSNFPARKLINFGIGGLTNFSSAPLRLSLYFGVVIFTISIIYGLFLIIKTLLYGVDVPGYASIFTAVLFIGGAQMLATGIMGEYIGRIFNETKNRPIYLIKKIIKNE